MADDNKTNMISFEELLKLQKSGQGTLMTSVKDKNGNQILLNVYGETADRLDHSLNVYLSMEDYGKLIGAMIDGDLKTPEGSTISDKYDGFSMTIDAIDKPLTWILNGTGNRLHLYYYERDNKKAPNLTIEEEEWEITDGKLEINFLEYEDKLQQFITAAFLALRNHLFAEGIAQKLQEMKLYSKAGVIVSFDNDQIKAQIVKGKGRPTLQCSMFLFGEISCRPYVDETIAEAELSKMSFEEKEQAAKDGNEEAMADLAVAYLKGEEVDQDFRKSLYWWEKLAAEDYATAQFNTGLYYAKGAGCRRNFAKAAEWMARAAQNGDGDAKQLAPVLAEASDNLKKANEGNAIAQGKMAQLYGYLGGSMDVAGSETDYKEAFKWAKKAAEKQDPEGLYNLGLCYEHGRGTSADSQKAMDAYKKAAVKNHAPSQWNLAVLFFQGTRFTMYGNNVEGYCWAYKAADQGYELAVDGLSKNNKTIEQLKEKYSSTNYDITLDGTQYMGRADRCENLKPGDKLTFKLTKDDNGYDALEVFYRRGSIGLIYGYKIEEIIALLKLERIRLELSVRNCIPRSKRGTRARNAEVHLNVSLTEIHQDTPEERKEKAELEKIEKMKADVQNQEDVIADLKKQLASARGKKTRAAKEAEAKAQEAAAEKKKLDEFLNENTEEKKLLEKTATTKRSVKSGIIIRKEEPDKQIGIWESTLEQVRIQKTNTVSKLNGELNSVRKELEEKQKTKENAVKEEAEKRQRAEKALFFKKKKAAEMEASQKVLAELDQEVERLSRDCAAKEEELREKTEEFASNEKDITAKLDEYRNKSAALQEEIEQIDRELEEIQSKVSNFNLTESILRNNLKIKEKAMRSQGNLIRDAEKKIGELEQQIEKEIEKKEQLEKKAENTIKKREERIKKEAENEEGKLNIPDRILSIPVFGGTNSTESAVQTGNEHRDTLDMQAPSDNGQAVTISGPVISGSAADFTDNSPAPVDGKPLARSEIANEKETAAGSKPAAMGSKTIKALGKVLEQLEAYYPEHKIFALDSIDGYLREQIAGLYRQLGFATIDEMLAAYGYEIISGEEVKKIRSFVLYTPGNEPDVIRDKIDSMLQRLEEYYPDRVITHSMQKDHKKLSQAVSGLYQWLGYANATEMLDAYGFRYEAEAKGAFGRPLARDYDEVIQTLVEKYKDGPKPKSMGDLLYDNPDLKGAIKTLSNKATEVFGMSLKKYLAEVGVFENREDIEAKKAEEKRIAAEKKAAEKKVAATGGRAARMVDVESVEYNDSEATPEQYFQYKTDQKGNVTITGFTGKMEEIAIPRKINDMPVRAIGKGAFQGCKSLVRVTMPDSIDTMMGDAFRDCISLKNIHLSNAITKIVNSTFKGCIGLTELNIPDGVTELKQGTFKESPITRLHIGRSLPTLDTRLFFRGDYDRYTGRQESTREISVTVDRDNNYLKAEDSVILSKDGKRIIAAMTGLDEYHVPEGVEVINAYAFADLCFLTDVTFPDSLTAIEEGAFSNTGLRNVNIGENIKSIGEKAFCNSRNLSSVIFHDGLEEIGDEAFAGCPIMAVFLPASVRTLGNGCFDSLNGRQYFYDQKQVFKIDPANPYFQADGYALYKTDETGKTLQFFYGKREVEDGAAAAPFGYEGGLSYTVKEGTTRIADGAFSYNRALSTIILPEGLISIGDSAFESCYNLTTVQMPDSIESIGKNAFASASIEEIQLGSALKYVGPGAFVAGNRWDQSSAKLENITVSEANQTFSVDKNALYMQKNDGTKTLVAYCGKEAFFEIPEGVSEVYGSAFSRSPVEEVQISASVKAIGAYAFQGANDLTRLRIASENQNGDVSYAVIYIPEITRDMYGYGDSHIHDLFMDCIRTSGDGGIFDYTKYDALFYGIPTTKDKILVATDRLKSAVSLVPLYRDQYLEYLRENAGTAVQTVIEYDDLDGLTILSDLGVFTGDNIDEVIELANGTGKVDIISYLINYKNAEIGISQNDPFKDLTLD